jgi:hypothetical protein
MMAVGDLAMLRIAHPFVAPGRPASGLSQSFVLLALLQWNVTRLQNRHLHNGATSVYL